MQNGICTFQPLWYYVHYNFLLHKNLHIKYVQYVSASLSLYTHWVQCIYSRLYRLTEVLYFSKCNISHCGCNLSHKFLIHHCTCPSKHGCCKCDILVWTSLHCSHMLFIPQSVSPSLPPNTPHAVPACVSEPLHILKGTQCSSSLLPSILFFPLWVDQISIHCHCA